jgi:hypothetical protein
MEITLNIPQNKWSKPVEVRTEVVQAICYAFQVTWLPWKPYEPYVNMVEGRFSSFHDFLYKKEGVVKFHETEMRAAFKALQEAGWFIIKHDMMNGTWYKLSEKNYSESSGNFIVTDFCEQWD